MSGEPTEQKKAWHQIAHEENPYHITTTLPFSMPMRLKLLEIEANLVTYFQAPEHEPIPVHISADMDFDGDLASQQSLVDRGIISTAAVYRAHRASDKFVFLSGYLTPNSNIDFMPLKPMVEYQAAYEKLPTDTLFFPYRPRFTEEIMLWHQSEIDGGIVISVENRLPAESRQRFLNYECRLGPYLHCYREFDTDIAQGQAQYPNWMAKRVMGLVNSICQVLLKSKIDPTRWLDKHLSDLAKSTVLFRILDRIFPPLEMCAPTSVARAALTQSIQLRSAHIKELYYPGSTEHYLSYERQLTNIEKYDDIRKALRHIEGIADNIKTAIDHSDFSWLEALYDPRHNIGYLTKKDGLDDSDSLSQFRVNFDIKQLYLYSPELASWVSPLCYAVSKGNLKLVNFMCETLGLNPNAALYRRECFYYLYPNGKYRGDTALTLAMNPATGGSVDMVRLLIHFGANPHQANGRHTGYGTMLSQYFFQIKPADRPAYLKLLHWPLNREQGLLQALIKPYKEMSLSDSLYLLNRLLPVFLEFPVHLIGFTAQTPTLDTRMCSDLDWGLLLLNQLRVAGPAGCHPFQIDRLKRLIVFPTITSSHHLFFPLNSVATLTENVATNLIRGIIFDGLHTVRELSFGTRKDEIPEVFGSTSIDSPGQLPLHLSTDESATYKIVVALKRGTFDIKIVMTLSPTVNYHNRITPEAILNYPTTTTFEGSTATDYPLYSKEYAQRSVPLPVIETGHLATEAETKASILQEIRNIFSYHIDPGLITLDFTNDLISINAPPEWLATAYQKKSLYEGGARLFDNYFPMAMRTNPHTKVKMGYAFEGGHNNRPFNLKNKLAYAQPIETEFLGFQEPTIFCKASRVNSKYTRVFSKEATSITPAIPTKSIFKKSLGKHPRGEPEETDTIFSTYDSAKIPQISQKTLLETRHTRFVIIEHVDSNLIPFLPEDNEFTANSGRYLSIRDIRDEQLPIRQFEHDGKTVTPFVWLFDYLSRTLSEHLRTPICILHSLNEKGNATDNFGKISYAGDEALSSSDPFLMLQALTQPVRHLEFFQEQIDRVFGKTTANFRRVTLHELSPESLPVFSDGEALFFSVFQPGKSYDLILQLQDYLKNTDKFIDGFLSEEKSVYQESIVREPGCQITLHLINQRFWLVHDSPKDYHPNQAKQARLAYLTHHMISTNVLEHAVFIATDGRELTAIQYRPDLILATDAFWAPYDPPEYLGSHSKRDEGLIEPTDVLIPAEDAFSGQQYYFNGDKETLPVDIHLTHFLMDSAFLANTAILNLDVLQAKTPRVGFDPITQKFITLDVRNCMLNDDPKVLENKTSNEIYNPYLKELLKTNHAQIYQLQQACFNNLQVMPTPTLLLMLAHPSVKLSNNLLLHAQLTQYSARLDWMQANKLLLGMPLTGITVAPPVPLVGQPIEQAERMPRLTAGVAAVGPAPFAADVLGALQFARMPELPIAEQDLDDLQLEEPPLILFNCDKPKSSELVEENDVGMG